MEMIFFLLFTTLCSVADSHYDNHHDIIKNPDYVMMCTDQKICAIAHELSIANNNTLHCNDELLGVMVKAKLTDSENVTFEKEYHGFIGSSGGQVLKVQHKSTNCNQIKT